MTDTQRQGRHREFPPERARAPGQRRRRRLVATWTAAGLAAVVFIGFLMHNLIYPAPSQPAQNKFTLPTTPDSYIGFYERGMPESYAGVNNFTATTGVKPRLVVYYSGWPEPFAAGFAKIAAKNDQVPMVQMNPVNTSLAAIAAGQYDSYLKTYAEAVRAYGHPTILSFGHEMNGYWYSWGNTHTSPADFVAAWRHIVTLFQRVGVRNVTWLWTVNTVQSAADTTSVPSPRAWWPGSSYVTWVGMDGYYINSSGVFASVFGPTIAVVRGFTRKPILIAETAATPAAGQPAKITDLFAGTRLYGVLGFVWFAVEYWRFDSAAAIVSFRRGAATYQKPAR